MSIPIVPMATTQYLGPRRFDRCFVDLTGDSAGGFTGFIRALAPLWREIEIRFQFQRRQDNRQYGIGSSLILMIKQGGEEGNCEFVVARDREAFAGAVLRWAAHNVC